MKISRFRDVAFVLLPLCAIILWSISLKYVDIGHMNDLGLVSVLPPSIIIALIILTISFCLTLQLQMRVPILLLHVVFLVFMLYSITTLVEEVPHLAVVYKSAGYTEYIMRTGTVKADLDFYFNWPTFYFLSSLMTQLAGYYDILSFAAWTPVFFNLIYLGPLYMIFSSATTNKRLVWLGLWFFVLTNWVEQDAFVPQGLDFFLYLVIIAILLRWFKVPAKVQPSMLKRRWQRLGRFLPLTQRLVEWLTAPDISYTPNQPRQRAMLLISIVIIFALVVSSHPLTASFTIASVTTLVICCRCRPFWLPILMAIMTGAWMVFMAQAFLVGHYSWLIEDFGHINDAIAQNVTNRATQGNLEHIFITDLRIVMTLFIWGLAFAGAVFRLRRGYHDVNYLLLAIAPFSLIVFNSYGGEIVLRVYFFSLPLMVFFAAGLFYTTPTSRMPLWLTVAVLGTSMILLGGFLFTRYGNERVDYMTYAEVDGIRYLERVAPPNSLFLSSEANGPLYSEGYEKYNISPLSGTLPDALLNKNVNAIVQFIESQKYPRTYLIFTRSQKAWAYELTDLPPGTLEQLEVAVLKSGKFKIIYNNPDVQIFEYLPPP
ncbi:MAG: hypothetical protein ACJ788_22455 [Ktedonobacteraceae bacterium]